MIRATKKGKKKPILDKSKAVDKLLEIENRHAEKLFSDVLWIAYRIKKAERERCPKFFFSSGENWPTPEDEAIRQVIDLKDVIAMGAAGLFHKVSLDILRDPELRDFYLRSMSRLLGKKGGRPRGTRAPHIAWLEEKLRFQEAAHRDTIPAFTAEEHFEELRCHPDIDGEDDDNGLQFHRSVLENEFGWRDGRKEPTVTLNSVREVLTRIRK